MAAVDHDTVPRLRCKVIAGAANLVLGKAEATPFAIVRGLDASYFGDGSIKDDALRRTNEDLFR